MPLCPDNIIIDQNTLTPKLSFEPLLLETLGIKDKPMSIENKIVFASTPARFDYFRSTYELDESAPYQIKLALNDPLY